jgi:hypothetical protein
LPPTQEEIRSRPRPKFRLGWPVLLPLALYVAVELVFGVPVARNDPQFSRDTSSYMTGRILGGPMMAMLVTWAVWRVFRRPRVLATALFATLVFLFALSEYRSASVARSRLAASILSSQMADWNNKLAALPRPLESLRFDELADIAVLETRVREVDESSVALRAMLDAGEQIPGQLDRRLAEIGMFRWEREREKAAFMNYISWPSERRMYEVDADFFEAMRDLLKFLRARPGEWTLVGATINDVRWQTMDEVKQYMKLRDRFVEAFQALGAELRKQRAATQPSATPPPGPRPS